MIHIPLNHHLLDLLQEYFIQLFDEEDEDAEIDNVIFSISNNTTMTPHPNYPNKMIWSTSELLELIKKDYPDTLPFKHLEAMHMDLPF